jgi:hypothetical protein
MIFQFHFFLIKYNRLQSPSNSIVGKQTANLLLKIPKLLDGASYESSDWKNQKDELGLREPFINNAQEEVA